MKQTADCKGCSETVRLSPERIARLVEIALTGKEPVTEEEYERRMGLCLSCPALQYGTTCRYCGCLVQIKTKLQTSQCPFPFAPKWG
jgi:hypothetical protein